MTSNEGAPNLSPQEIVDNASEEVFWIYEWMVAHRNGDTLTEEMLTEARLATENFLRERSDNLPRILDQ
jgi:hypothetical protein